MPETVHTKTRRIAKNTVLLYLRSLISLFISLWTSRLVLKGLGVDDYGGYGVVGSFVSMFSIVTGSLSKAISRFLNYAMGTGNKEEQANTFALSLNIMAILALIVVFLTETFGLWYLYNKMNITPGRETAAFWCFQFSVLASVSSFLVVSFTGSIIAHEKMGVFAYIDVGEVVLKFLIALLITLSLGDVDKLVLYAALLLAVTLSKQMVSRIYAMKNFEECRIRWYWDKKKFIEMFTYAGWSFLGKTSGTFTAQGVNMVVNVVFGPAVNAARSLSWTVSHSISIFVNNFTTAINPQITQSYAAGDYGYMKSLLIRGTKFTFYIMWMIALPLFLEADFVVSLWLGEYPEHTVNFIRIAIIVNTIGTLFAIFAMGIHATGRIAQYQILFSFWEFLQFGVVYILLHHGFAPEWTYICAAFAATFKVLTMVFLCRHQLNVPIADVLRHIVLPVFIVIISSTCLPALLHTTLAEGWFRFILVLFSSLLVSSLVIFFIGCDSSERRMLSTMFLDKLHSLIS